MNWKQKIPAFIFAVLFMVAGTTLLALHPAVGVILFAIGIALLTMISISTLTRRWSAHSV